MSNKQNIESFEREMQQALSTIEISPAPQTWDRIESSLAASTPLSPLLLAARWFGAAAASVLIAVAANMLLFTSPVDSSVLQSMPRISEFVPLDSSSLDIDPIEVASTPAPKVIIAMKSDVSQDRQSAAEYQPLEHSLPPEQPAAKQQPARSNLIEEVRGYDETIEVSSTEPAPSIIRPARGSHISLLRSSGTASKSGGTQAPKSQPSPIASYPKGYSELISMDNYAPRDVRHHAPITYALSAAFEIGERWSIESGVSYSSLVSELKMPYSSQQVIQKVQFVGVPLYLRYALFESSSLSLYAGGGAQIERCISARLNSTQIDENPWHTSLEAHIGAQHKFNPWLAIYAEPELNYYLSAAQLTTSRTESPLSLNIRIGIRFLLGGR